MTAPSANRQGRVPAFSVEGLAEEFLKNVDLVIDGGTCPQTEASTILGLDSEGRVEVLRHGAIGQATLASILGYRPTIRGRTG